MAKLRTFTGGGRRKSSSPQELKPFLVYARHIQNLNLQQEEAIAEFLSGSDVFVNLATGYGKPLIYHLAPLVSGD